MKISQIIFNDTGKPLVVRVVDNSEGSWNGKRHVIESKTEMQFDLDIPDDKVLYFKQWDHGVAFLSYCDPKIVV